MPDPDRDAAAKQALDHAWNWFALHSSQRMQTFRFFLIGTAFLGAAYGSLLEEHRYAAVAVALVGAWLGFWFNQLDTRTSELIKASESVLKTAQARLADQSGVSELKIVETVEQAPHGGASHRVVMAVIQWTIVAVFLLGAAYGLLA